MPVDQLHYTSCRTGTLGRAGIQVRAQSEGFSELEVREAVAHSGYQRPSDLNKQADPATIDREFPRALRFYRLPSDRWALTLTCYAGQDYSGRWGNVFAHSLAAEGDPPGWAIDLFRWSGWVRRLALDQDTQAPPDPLMKLEINSLEETERFCTQELQQLVSNTPRGRARLENMAKALFHRDTTGRVLMIRAACADAPRWIASVLKLFPPGAANQLSFNTFQYESRNCSDINATAYKTHLRFDQAARDHQFFLFDLIQDQDSELPADGPGDSYASVVVPWFLDEPEALRDFHCFANRLRVRFFDERLVELLWLFRFTSMGSVPSDEGLTPALTLLQSLEPCPARSELLQNLRKRLPDLLAADRFEAALALARALTQEGDPGLACDSWIELRLACAAHPKHLSRVRALHEDLIANDVVQPSAIAERLLASEVTPTLIAGAQQSGFSDTLKELCQAAKHAQRHPWAERSVRALLNAYCSHDLTDAARTALNTCSKTPAQLAEVALLLVAEHSDQGKSVGQVLYEVLSGTPPTLAADVWAQLSGPSGWPILLGAWHAEFAASKDPLSTFRSLARRARAHAPDLWARHGQDLARSHWQRLDSTQREHQAAQWLLADARWLSEDLRHAATHAGNLTLLGASSFSPKLPAAIEDWAKELGLQLQPNGPALLSIAQAAQRGPLALAQYNQLIGALKRVNAPQYARFLELFLQPALTAVQRLDAPPEQPRASRPPDSLDTLLQAHREVCTASLVQPLHDVFVSRYRSALALEPDLRVSVALWLNERQPPLHALRERVLDALAFHAAQRSDEEFGTLLKWLEESGDVDADDSLQRWLHRVEVERARQPKRSRLRSWARSLRNLFRRRSSER